METVLILFGFLVLIGSTVCVTCRHSLHPANALFQAIIAFAVRALPDDKLKERFSEEWQSHLDDVPTSIGKLSAALGFVFASIKIELEFAADRIGPLSKLWSRWSLYLTNEENRRKFIRLNAMLLACMTCLLLAMYSLCCIIIERFPERQAYSGLAAAAFLWTVVNLFWIVRYRSKVWPVMLFYITAELFFAVAMTLMLSHSNEESFALRVLLIMVFWLFVAITAIGGLYQICEADFRNSRSRLAQD